ncbi:MAG: LamG-like jellyroll fold domain-containing protein, partial [Planctomycetota bacterium]
MSKKLFFLTAVVILLGIVAAPASAGLVSWWKLDDGGGSTAVDSGSAGNNGSVNGPLWVTGKLNGGLDFDGVDDYVEIPNESDYDMTSSITVAVWLKLDPGDTTTNFMSFVTKGRESAWALQRNARTSNASFVLNGLTSWDGLIGSANVFDGEWHHVAGVYDGSRISLYVDATEDTFMDVTGSIGTNDWGVFIGSNAEDVNSASGYRHCNGIVDDVRIYDHALNESEIAVLAGFDPAYPRNPNPRDGAKSIDPDQDLSWTAGSDSTSSDVYFGTNFNDVETATTSDSEYMGNQTSTSYNPGTLAINTYYYWRIDAIDTSNPSSPWVGDVWTFKTSSGEADECTNWQTLHPEWIFCDDFEDGTSMVREGRYFAYDSDDGDFVITDEAGFNNSKGMRVIFQNGEVSAGGMKLGFGRTPSSFDQGIRNTEDFREIYYRMYLKMQNGWSGNPAKLSRATIFHANDWSQAMIAHIWQGTGYALGIDPVRCVNASSQVVCIGYNDFANMTWLGARSGSTPVFRTDHSDTWYCVEAHVKLNDAGQSNGIQEFWVDGQLEARRDDLNFVESYTDYAINIVLFENYWNTGSVQLQERYFDNIVVSTQAIGEFGAGPQLPGQASNPSPGNGTSDISITADLSWTAGSGTTSHDVYFGTSSPGSFQGNQTTTTFDTGTMSNDTTYYWRIDEINAEGTTTGVVWNFTTEAAPQPPGQASNPNPGNGSTDIDVDANLSWTAGSGSTSSDVYFGTDSTPDAGELQGNQTATTFEPGTMAYSTTYYWRIDEVNAQGTTTGNVWNFTTEAAPQPPGQAGNPSPADSATDVSVDADLSWNAGSGATSRDVYFGTSSPGTFQGNQTATTFDCGSMSND